MWIENKLYEAKQSQSDMKPIISSISPFFVKNSMWCDQTFNFLINSHLSCIYMYPHMNTYAILIVFLIAYYLFSH